MDFHHFNRPIFLCQPSKNAFGATSYPKVKTEVKEDLAKKVVKQGYQAQYRARPTPLTLHAKPSVRPMPSLRLPSDQPVALTTCQATGGRRAIQAVVTWQPFPGSPFRKCQGRN